MIRLFCFLSLLLGVMYPLTTTFLGNLFFHDQVEGSLVKLEGNVVGSKLLAQSFTQDKFFWSRPSATQYSSLPSGGSQLSPYDPRQSSLREERKLRFKFTNDVPEQLITASASGLDPHLDLESLDFQISRVAASRGFSEKEVTILKNLINEMVQYPQLSFLGERVVNVLELNLKLDSIKRY